MFFLSPQTLTELTVNRDDFVDNSKVPDHSSPGSGGGINQDVFVVGGSDDRTTSFFAQPGILAGKCLLVWRFPLGAPVL